MGERSGRNIAEWVGGIRLSPTESDRNKAIQAVFNLGRKVRLSANGLKDAGYFILPVVCSFCDFSRLFLVVIRFALKS
jgi:hypothetical protein